MAWAIAAMLIGVLIGAATWFVRQRRRRATDPSPDVESTFMERVAPLLEQGETVRAEAMAVDALRRAKLEHGEPSPELALANNDLGRVLLSAGQHERAVDCFRRAAAAEFPGDPIATRDRLTYQVNLGTLLLELGKIEDAETVLAETVRCRSEFYGEDHPGYAFGLEPFAEVLLKKRNLEKALEVGERCMQIFVAHRHERLASILALLAHVAQIMKAPGPIPAFLPRLSDDEVRNVAGFVVGRLHATTPKVGRGLVEALLPVFRERLGANSPAVGQLVIALSHRERALGNYEAQANALRGLAETWETNGDLAAAVSGWQGVSLALADAGAHEDAQAVYERAFDLSKRLGNPALSSQVLRNRGLHLAESGRSDEAEGILRKSVREASGDSDARARAQAALGVFLHHRERGDDAARFLRASLSVLPTGDPDAICARNHLKAIEEHGSCGCGEQSMEAALGEVLGELVRGQLPPGLLSRLDLEFSTDGSEPNVNVELAREPTDRELEHLDRVIRHALADIRRKLRERYGE